jgi:protein-S-isoprenylcysteine O-methyltransferase Ste14
LFRHRTSLPLPIAAAIVLIPRGETPAGAAAVLSGVALTASGEALRLWGVRHIGVISRTRSDRLGPLVDTGPFGYVRNPLYIGNMLLWVGFAVAAGLLWLAPVALALFAAEYHWIVRWEEALLLTRLGDEYRRYVRRVPRWIPRLRTGTEGGRRRLRPSSVPPPSPFAATLFSERGTLLAIAAGYLLLWLKARF